MRIDSFGPRTWLLAGIAGWGVLAWLLALAGMGGQIDRLPDDPSLVGRLPRLPGAPPPRLGPLAQYGEIAARPVFTASRKPQPFFVAGQEAGEQAQTFDFVLSSVLITPQVRLAILQPSGGGEGVRLKVGDAPESAKGWRVAEINPRSVVIAGPDGERTLELRVFDGASGQGPSATPSTGSSNGIQRQDNATATTATSAPVAPPGPVMATPSKATQVPPPATQSNTGPGGNAASQPAAQENTLTTEQQMEAIRQRIEARRAQLRQQGELPPGPNKTK